MSSVASLAPATTPHLTWYVALTLFLLALWGASRFILPTLMPRLKETLRLKGILPDHGMEILGQQPLDLKHKLMVVRWHAKEHCLLITPTQVVILDTRETPYVPYARGSHG